MEKIITVKDVEKMLLTLGRRVTDAACAQHEQMTKDCPSFGTHYAVAHASRKFSAKEQEHVGTCPRCQSIQKRLTKK